MEPSVLAKVDCWSDAPAHVTVDCYRLNVPETRGFDLAVGPGQTLSLPVAIIRAGAGAKPDPVVYLAGGPGDGAWLDPDRIEWWWEFVANTEWPRQRDLILYDQRGSGLVEPRIDCVELEAIALELLTMSDAAMAGKLQREAAAACAKRLVMEGHNPGAYTSRDGAADLHDLFRALKVPAWNVYGLSYGTRLGLEYMRQYPRDIRSVILDSVIPPEAQFLEGDAATTDRAFRMVFDACARDALCHLQYADLGARLTALVKRLDAEPLKLTRPQPDSDGTVKIVVDGNFLINRLFNLLYNRADIELVPQVIDFYDRHIEAEITRDVDQYIADYLGRPDFGDAMFLGVHCQEEVPFNDMAKALNAYRRYPLLAGLAVGGESESFAETCAAWRAALPPQPLRASDNEPVISELPTLLLTGLYDPVTPPAYARLAAAHLVNSFYLEFDGIGHDVLGNEPCANDVAQKFLDEPHAAPRDICMVQSTPPQFVKPVE
ncbi:MAG: alpha/beta hydrolase [Rhodospirillaceae bacterium]|nr:alpha/beta hydrolase [Rhodospirillaceae bacterium]